MQHITVNASTKGLVQAGDWSTNGAGRAFHTRLGFGWLQGEALVAAARRWRGPTPLQARVTSGVLAVAGDVPGPNQEQEFSATIPACSTDSDGLVAACVEAMEHAVVKFTLDAERHGDITFALLSPAGTRSELMGKRSNDANSNKVTWQFSSVHFWDETEVAGSWRLRVGNQGRGRATLVSWELLLYGRLLPPTLAHPSGAPVAATAQRPGHHHPADVTCRMCPAGAYVDGAGNCRACSRKCSRGCFGPGLGGCVVEEAPRYNPPAAGLSRAQAAAAGLATLALLAAVVLYVHRSYTRSQHARRREAHRLDAVEMGAQGAFAIDSSSDDDGDDDEGVDTGDVSFNQAPPGAASADSRPLLPPEPRFAVL